MKKWEVCAIACGGSDEVMEYWRLFAKSGNCSSIDCHYCPFLHRRCMHIEGVSECERKKMIIEKLNMEV